MKVFIIGFLILLVSCGSKNSGPKTKKIIENTYGNPVIAKLFDEECDENHSLSRLGYMDVFYKQSGMERAERFDFRDYQGNPLSGKFVKNVYHSGRYVDRFRYNETLKLLIPESSRMVQKSQPLYICGDDRSYPRDSIEASAFSALLSLEKSYQFYVDSTNDTSLPSISLNMNERYVKEIVYKETDNEIFIASSDLVDNAIYSFENKSISFYPQNKENPIFGSSPAWRIPFITSHEMGHHVLNYYIPVDEFFSVEVVEQYIKHSTQLAGNNGDFFFGKILVEEMEPQTEGILKILLAYHEAFADIFAYLSLGPNFNMLVGVDCMQTSRDVDSNIFEDYTEKKLSYTVVERYLKPVSVKDLTSKKSCAIPNFKDPHDVGAVVAHTMGTLLKLGNIMTAADKLRVMTNWVKLVKVKFPLLMLMPPKEFFKETLKMFFEVLNNYSALNENHCVYIDQAFAGLDYVTTYSEATGECSVK
ncbi:MAG: hypothetical protein A2202_08940 [Bdellovibrionales bacterium RIFOXYA1_FULL_36_14]|nr:MAG: hypothetical protein A2202_08940 [Bdellovibrionales bacterium RIFOXYA1_FULL_36_14]